MALILRDILEESKRRFQLTLLAGEAGLDRVMDWVYVAEDYTTADFLHGGELLITTGVISGGSAAWVMRFLRHIIPQRTCGLIINEGPYLSRENLTQEVLAYCDAQRFPLLVMPWHIHIYDITRCYYDRLFTVNRRNEAFRRALGVLFDPAADHSAALAALPAERFPAGGTYAVAALAFPDRQTLPRAEDAGLFTGADACLAGLGTPCTLVRWEGLLCLVAGSTTAAEEAAVRLQEAASRLCPDTPLFAGIGGAAEGLQSLSHGVRQARAALQLGLYHRKPVFRYAELGLFQLLLEVSDREALRAYAEARLGAVHAYDERHGSALAETLYLYLLHDRSLQAAAEAAYCHRNTVRHRLLTLEQNLGLRLDDPAVRLELMTAFLVEQYLAATETL